MAEAQFNLGVMYQQGYGTRKDFKEAARWFREAAQQGIVQAQTNLGVMYVMGLGVPRDMVYAHMWLNISASSGSADGQRGRDMAAAEMTSYQLAEAEKLARECLEKKLVNC